MSRREFPLRWSVALLGILLAGAAGAQEHQQRFVLQPGWNAVYLEVQPEPNDLEVVFAGIPVRAVWSWEPDDETVEALANPADGLLDLQGWFAWFPEPLPESFLTDLFAIDGNRAYLVEVAGTEPVVWTVEGRPLLEPYVWATDTWTLTGFHVDPDVPPTFGDFFADSRAHAGQPIYRLNGDGVWESIDSPFATPIRSGQAYWVRTDGGSSYQGPLAVDIDIGDALDFGVQLSSRQISVETSDRLPRTIVLRTLENGGIPFVYRSYDETTLDEGWPRLPANLGIRIPDDGTATFELGVRRRDLAGSPRALLSIEDGRGVRWLLSAEASEVFGPPAVGGPSLRSRAVGAVDEFAGLWLGVVSLTAVSEARLGGTDPRPVSDPLEFRILLHVDAAGRVRLLKEVIQMWRDGTTMPSADFPGFEVVDEPGEYVLLTDENLIPDFEGATVRDGTPVGLRLSVAAYDFPENSLPMTGGVGPGQSLEVVLSTPSGAPTNPYRHRFHPDHDNLGPLYLEERPEAMSVTRRMELDFLTADPDDVDPPDWGSSLLQGTYRETVTGLHKNPIVAGGEFVMRRMTATPELDPSP